jgi:hypothetical protein
VLDARVEWAVLIKGACLNVRGHLAFQKIELAHSRCFSAGLSASVGRTELTRRELWPGLGGARGCSGACVMTEDRRAVCVSLHHETAHQHTAR